MEDWYTRLKKERTELHEKIERLKTFLYENEMKELFGVNIQMINLDYNNKLYRINEEAPFLK